MKENKRGPKNGKGGEETADRRQDGKSRQREKLQVDERTGREQEREYLGRVGQGPGRAQTQKNHVGPFMLEHTHL